MKDVSDVTDVKPTVFSVVSEALETFERNNDKDDGGCATINNKPCRQNPKGHWVEVDKIEPIDLLRDEVVADLWKRAKRLHDFEVETKKYLFATLFSFFDLSAMEHGKEWRNPKGNTTVPSFCGRYKVQLSVSKYMEFDERLTIAKQLIDEWFIDRLSEGDDDIKELVLDAFNVDNKGNLSVYKLLGLLKYKFEGSKWKQAMAIIRESVQIVGSKEHLRFYRRDEHGKYRQMSLDFSSL